MTNTAIDLSKLTREEKFTLVGDLWDDLASTGEIPLLPWQAQLISERLEEQRATPGVGSTWEEVIAHINGCG